MKIEIDNNAIKLILIKNVFIHFCMRLIAHIFRPQYIFIFTFYNVNKKGVKLQLFIWIQIKC